jgi:hypothetical protein
MEKTRFELRGHGSMRIRSARSNTTLYTDDLTKLHGKKTKESGKKETRLAMEAEVNSTWLLGKEVGGIKMDRWWCGDYSCDVGGSTYNAGDVQRICFVTPPATGCPTPTTLGDGSKWSLTGGCRQDG